MEQASFNINQFNKQREHSWKVTLVFWAALVGTTGILESGVKINIPTLVIVVGALLYICLYCFFIHL